MVMALCQSSYNQGVYGLVTNLGSLVVRTIFFPVEEAAFRAFSKPSSKPSLHNAYHSLDSYVAFMYGSQQFSNLMWCGSLSMDQSHVDIPG